MHREFSTLLQLQAQRWGRSRGFEIGPIEPVVDSCPYPEEGDLSSAIVFELARRFSPLLPDEIALSLVDLHCGSEYQNLFSIAMAGGGFLNARPTPFFVQQFLELLRPKQGGVNQLFSASSFVIKRAHSSFELLPFSVQWDLLGMRAARHADVDIRRFASQRISSGAKNDRLMLLALLGDKELEADPYLQGLTGRQNVPWYLKRFFEDSERAVVGWGSRQSEVWGEVLPEVSSFYRELLFLRFELLKARRRNEDGGVVALGGALGLVRQFYSYFNNPRYRLRMEGDEVAAQLSELTTLSREILKTVLRLLPLAPD